MVQRPAPGRARLVLVSSMFPNRARCRSYRRPCAQRRFWNEPPYLFPYHPIPPAFLVRRRWQLLAGVLLGLAIRVVVSARSHRTIPGAIGSCRPNLDRPVAGLAVPTGPTFPIFQYVSGTLAATACTLAAAVVVHGTVQVLAQIGLQEPNPAGRGTALR